MIKILFINAVNPASEIETRYTPLGILCLSASLKRSFGEKRLNIRLVNKNVEKHILTFKPDIAGITSVSQNFNYAIRYASLAHSYGVPVMIGGIHISMLPGSLTDDMDVGCIGEGERTIVRLMNVFSRHKGFPPSELKKINGIVFRENGKLVQTPAAVPLNNLDDQIPFPDRSLEGPIKHGYLFSSRGCPFRCVFCASSRYWNRVRFFSPEHVFDEIEFLKNQSGAKMISFYDDLFVADKKRLHDIADLVEKSNLTSEIRFTCSCRSNLVTKDIVRDLKRMGIVSVGLGLESGNSRILRYLKGRTVTVEDNHRAIKLLTDAGIRVNASFIIGSPDETEEEMMDTYNFIKKSKLSFVDVYVLTPYPGTPVWDEAKAKGLVNEQMNWGKLNVNFEINHENAVIMSETVSRKRLYQIYKRFRRQRLIRNIRSLASHPMLIDLPKIASGTLKEKLLMKPQA